MNRKYPSNPKKIAKAVGRMVELECLEALKVKKPGPFEDNPNIVSYVKWSFLNDREEPVNTPSAGEVYIGLISYFGGWTETRIRSILNQERSLEAGDRRGGQGIDSRWDFEVEDGGFPNPVHLLSSNAKATTEVSA